MSTHFKRSPGPATGLDARAHGWTFLSNHAHVLISLAATPDLRLRDIALQVGITERAVQNVLADLEREGLVTRERDGRRNRYALHLERPLRHPIEAHRSVRELVDLVTGSGPLASDAPRRSRSRRRAAKA